MKRSDNRSQSILKITFWKKTLVLAFIAFFLLTLVEYFRGELEGPAQWLWPMLFVPLILYLLGVVYGDVPARFYNLKALKPFPVPFAVQYDRCVLALIVLFTGLFLNILLLLSSIIFQSPPLLIALYSMYMVLMLMELPNSLRIFRFIQHINTLHYVNVINPNTFRPAMDYYSPEQDEYVGQKKSMYLKSLYESLMIEAEKLAQDNSPLKREQQIALNLAVRSGEAIRRCRIAMKESDTQRLKANLLLLDSLQTYAELDTPDDLDAIRQAAMQAEPEKEGNANAS